MKNDKKWLKESVNELKTIFNGREMGEYETGRLDGYSHVSMLIDHLDEPETLSQDWIDENKVVRVNNVRKMTTSDVVPVEKLKNLLVSKQGKQEVEENFYTFDNAKKWLHDNGFVVFEKDKLDEEVQRMVDETYEATNEKTVIPQFVADFIRATKPSNSLRLAFEYIAQRKIDNHDDELALWIEEGNSELFARAWLDGYKVEKEKKYFIKEPVTGQFLIRDDSQSRGVKWVDGFSTSPSYFTETEIKAIDKRFWTFAQEVTE